MGASELTRKLQEQLAAEPSFRTNGFNAHCGPTGGVVVDRWNHVRGVWHFHLNSYFWTPAGYAEPTYRAGSLEEALSYTLQHVAKV